MKILVGCVIFLDAREFWRHIMNTITEILNITKQQGLGKLNTDWFTTLIKGIIAGIFIGIGGTAAIRTAVKFADNPGLSSILGSFVFTIGFVLIITLGVQLFTSNSLMTFNLLEKETKIKHIITNWGLVWLGNLIGTFVVALIMYYSKSFHSVEQEYIQYLVTKKIHLDYISAIMLGIMCNMIIVLTVMLVNASKSYPGKVMVAIFGVMIFLISGYEHVVANMYYFCLGVLLEPSTSVLSILVHNLVPVTIGNIVGGAVLIPLLFYVGFIKKKA